MSEFVTKMMTQVCSTCGSQDVLADAFVTWDFGGQCWEISDTFAKNGFCEKCQGQCSIEEVEYDDEHTKENNDD